MVLRSGVIFAFLAVAAPSMAHAVPSLQAEYEAAQAAFDQKDFTKAAAGFEKLVSLRPEKDPTNRTTALLRARLGSARFALKDYRGAAEALELALPGLAAEADKVERQNALFELGKAQEALLDYAAARTVYAAMVAELEAEKSVTGGTLELARIALARVSLFDEPEFARRQLDLALPGAEALLGKENDVLAEIYTLRGRTELMAANKEEAYTWFGKALMAAGGLGKSVTLSDVRIRGDLALAAQLMGRSDNARKYLAYTGAGRMRGKNPLHGADMPLPPCGEATGLKPEDAAVVEFAIGDDGQVTHVQPIYATRPGPVALDFARAVADWSWTAESLQGSDLFWRSAIRLELRCTKEVQRTDIGNTFMPALTAWLNERSMPMNDLANEGMSGAAAAAKLRIALTTLEGKVGREHLSLLPLLVELGRSSAVSDVTAREMLTRASAIAATHKAPVDVQVLLGVLRARIQPGLSGRKWVSGRKADYEQLLAELRRRNEANGRAGAWARVELAYASEADKEFDKAGKLYREVIAMPEAVLPAADSIRQMAVVRLASQEAAAKRFNEAQGLLQTVGLNPEQCELVDVKPVALSAYVTSSDFPREALNWGFEGWVKVSYDIDTEGRVVEPRTVIAYPPFIFGPATERSVRRFRYQPLYRAGKGIGCTGYQQSIGYKIAR